MITRRITIFLTAAVILTGCFRSPDQLPGADGNARIYGVVRNIEGRPLSNVTVSTVAHGKTISMTTGSDGEFELTPSQMKRGDACNISFQRDKFETANRAAVLELPNLRSDLGTVNMVIEGGSEVQERTVFGTLLDNFSYDPLAGANVLLQDSLGNNVTAKTDDNGYFELTSKFFALNSDYALSVYKENYIPRTNVVVKITARQNKIRNNPVRLYQMYGDIKGTIEDDTTGNPLAGATVTVTDSNNTTHSDPTDASGNFSFESQFFHVGKRYTVTVSHTDYHTATDSVFIATTGDNNIDSEPLKLMQDIRINGQVAYNCNVSGISNISSAADCPGGSTSGNLENVTVILSYNGGSEITRTETDSSGNYNFQGTQYLRGDSYKLTFLPDTDVSPTHDNGFSVVEDTSISSAVKGDNTVNVTLQVLDAPTMSLTGTVNDYWSGSVIENATVRVQDDNGIRQTLTNAGGIFTLEGTFTSGNVYEILLRKNGYSGKSDVDWQKFNFTHTGATTIDLDTGNSDDLKLYPIGIFMAGSPKMYFKYQIKQGWQPFLTGKPGLNISARGGLGPDTDYTVTAAADKDADTFYLHIDNPMPRAFPAIPKGSKRSTYIGINAEAEKGMLSERIAGDPRIYQIGMRPDVFYHFYVATPGTFTVQTDGNADTVIDLYDDYTVLTSDNNSGSGSNAKVTRFLSRGWHFVNVKQANTSTYGRFDVWVTGPDQQSPVLSLPASYTTDDIIISWYDSQNSKMYIAGAGESGSSGEIKLEMIADRGKLIRGTFKGTMRSIDTSGDTRTIPSYNTAPGDTGFFNIIRQK